MDKILPQVTYSPEGMLSIRTNLTNDTSDRLEQGAINNLLTLNGTNIDQEGVVNIKIKDALDFTSPNKKELTRDLLRDIGLLTLEAYDLEPERREDPVIEPHLLGMHGFTPRIYPHFQRWLNAEPTPIDKQTAVEVLSAMSVPLNYTGEWVASELTLGSQYADAGGLQVFITKNKWVVRDEERLGSVNWNQVRLKTLGTCAYLGIDQLRYSTLRVNQPHQPWLYEMREHNIDTPIQFLSLFLGLGALAYRAAQYDGNEDIIAEANWEDTSII